MSLFAELKRRRVFRALVGYGIAAFAVLQVIEPVMHGLRWPDAVLGYVVVALALGFPVVVGLAWIFDVNASPDVGLSRPRVALVLAAIGILAGAPGVAWYFVLRRTPAAADRSIAVLPFASLSAEKDTAYFADGFHDELLRQLARLGNLQVISRTSVLQYKEGARNLREIGEALGVSSIVEGSVQRDGNRVRVEAKLVDARTDRQLWAELYDRDLTDVFAIQSDVALEIAHALRAKLSPAQKQQIERKPTQNTDAYDLYLRALDYDNRPDVRPQDLGIAEKLYRQAIERDASFALARARLAMLLLNRLWFMADTPDSVVEEARLQADESLRLDPDLPQAHLARGYFHYRARREYGDALREFAAAREGAPGEAMPAMGWVQRRQGRFEEAIRSLQEGARLDPKVALFPISLGETLQVVRRYPEADQAFNRALTLAPDSDNALALQALNAELWKADTAPAKSLLRQIARRLDAQGRLGGVGNIVTLMWHNPREALVLLDQIPVEVLLADTAVYPKALLSGIAHEELGEAAKARAGYSAALPRLEGEVAAHPERSLPRTLLAEAYGGLGRKEDALREVRRARELLPLSKDALDGSWPILDLALLQARFGDADGAIETIRGLLAAPSLLSPGLLRVDPRWAPLYGDARFRKLAEMDAQQAVRIPAPASR